MNDYLVELFLIIQVFVASGRVAELADAKDLKNKKRYIPELNRFPSEETLF